jgi:hypothetical protein
MTDNVEIAAQIYISRRERSSHSDGSFDKAQRFYPDDDEEQSCCDCIRRPSRGYPYSFMVHCRTLGHVCAILRVEEPAVRQVLSKIDPQRLKAAAAREEKRQLLIQLIRERLTRLPDDSIVDSLMMAVTPVKSLPILTKWSTIPPLALSALLLDRLPEKTESDQSTKTRIKVYLPLIRPPIPMASAA